MHKDITIGKEHDENAFEALKEALTVEGAREVDRRSGVGGSQEINAWRFEIGGQMIEIMSETYIGLSISGDEQLVSRIAEVVRQRLAENEKQD